MDHREQQQEYRRLKRERAARLVREEAVRSLRTAGLKLQARVILSHDEVLALLGDRFPIDSGEIMCIEPCEGGWSFVLTKQA